MEAADRLIVILILGCARLKTEGCSSKNKNTSNLLTPNILQTMCENILI